MNVSDVINDDMTLAEKLKAIEEMTQSQLSMDNYNKKNNRPIGTPVDPADLTICDGCE